MAGLLDSIVRNITGGDDYDKKAKELQERFISDLNTSSENGGESSSRLFSADMKHNLGLQRQRTAEYGISVKRHYYVDQNSATAISPLMGKDKRYITRIPVTVCIYENTFASESKVLKKEKAQGVVSSFAVFTDSQVSDTSYCCPNCGDVNKVSQLLERGCRSCRTRFIMPDLYPRITSFYTYKNKPYTSKLLLPISILTGIVLAALCFIFLSLSKIETGMQLLVAIPATAFVGVVFGFILNFIIVMSLLVADAINSSPRVSAIKRTRKKLPRFMQKYDPFFSLDFFVGKVNNLLKTLVYIDSYDNCSVYEKNGENPYKDILNVEYQGAVDLNYADSDGQYVYVDIDIYTKTTRIQNNKLRQSEEIFRMELCRSVSVQDDYNATIHNIECHSCGASFDAVRERNCPFCRNPYNLRDYDWIVTDFAKY